MKRSAIFLILGPLLLLFHTPYVFGQAQDVHDQRAHKLFTEIRCPVCDGQSIAESDVLISISIRSYVTARINAGDTDEEIKTSLTERYGEDILLEPSFKVGTLVLWLTPWIGTFLLITFVWKQTRDDQEESI